MSAVKFAISVETALFEEAEVAAREMNLSRSGLYAHAMAELLLRRRAKLLIEQVNAAYDKDPSLEEEDRQIAQGMRRHFREVAEEW